MNLRILNFIPFGFPFRYRPINCAITGVWEFGASCVVLKRIKIQAIGVQWGTVFHNGRRSFSSYIHSQALVLSSLKIGPLFGQIR